MAHYGIDLGTTYSAISFVNNNGIAEIINNSEDEPLTPSVVYFESEDNIVVGSNAVENVPPDKTDRVASADHIKRIMHTTDSSKYFKCFGKEKDPVYLSSLILKKLIGNARNAGHDVRDVVITCPAYFDQTAKHHTKEAGILAGIEESRLRIITEPVAAALYYAIKDSTAAGRTVLVYDLGGGTFDVTVVRISQTRAKVEQVCIAGNPLLGGKDWDQRLIKHYARELGFPNEKNNETDMRVWHQQFVDYCTEQLGDEAEAKVFAMDLSKWAEDDKRKLTANVEITRRLPFGTSKKMVTLSRQQFYEMTSDLLNQTLALTESVLNTARNEGVNSFDTCLLVGGSTFMPQVKSELQTRFGDKFKEIKQFQPNQAVALGAAHYAEAGPEAVGEVLPRSYGIRCYDPDQDKRYIANLAFRDTPFPAEAASDSFHTVTPQDGVFIAIYESTSKQERLDDIEKHKLLAEETWDFGRTVDPSEAISYVFKITQNGILELYGRLPNVPDKYIKLTLQGDTDENVKQQRRAQSAKDMVR